MFFPKVFSPKMESLKCLCVLLCLPFVNTLFAGDPCHSDEKFSGNCKLLSECEPLLKEIQMVSHPMPLQLRIKLQSLSCGFEFDEPLVCCSEPQPQPSGVDIPNLFENGIIGMGGGQSSNQNPTDNLVNIFVDDSSNASNLTEHSNFDDGNSRSGTSGLDSRPPDISNHPNLRLLPQNCGTIESDRIFGGNRTRLYEMPWMVLLSYLSGRGLQLNCGGTLINEWYVLTAAHCVEFLGRLQLVGVVLGEYDVREDPDCERVEGQLLCAPSIRNVSIAEVIPHPNYSLKTLNDDIALLRLSEPADFTLDNMKPICLPTTQELQGDTLVGKQGIVAGWGATDDGLQSSVLLSVNLPVIANKECRVTYKGDPQIHDTQLCAGGVPDKDSCGGDSGGPLMYPGQRNSDSVRYYQRGIVSFGSKRCGIGSLPGVYTRVGYYMDWILNNMHS